MCGIAGFLNYPQGNINRIQSLLYHRGPDEQSSYTYKNLELAHTRLSIIDLDPRSNQPFIDCDNNLLIVFNGEIYNWRSLKKELQEIVYKFKTESDTEVLLKGFILWKEQVLNRLEGMFSFGIFNFNNFTYLHSY